MIFGLYMHELIVYNDNFYFILFPTLFFLLGIIIFCGILNGTVTLDENKIKIKCGVVCTKTIDIKSITDIGYVTGYDIAFSALTKGDKSNT